MKLHQGFFLIKIFGTCNNSDITDDANFGLALENEVSVSRVGVSNSTAKSKVDYLTLSKKWGTSPEIAKKKLQFTTYSGIRTVLRLSLSQRFRTNDRALRYWRLPQNMFRDTLIAGTTSKRGNKYADFFRLISGGRLNFQ